MNDGADIPQCLGLAEALAVMGGKAKQNTWQLRIRPETRQGDRV